MTDIVSIQKLQVLHPKIREAALNAYQAACTATPANVHPVISQGLRTFSESETIYNQGRTTPGKIVSNAQPGQSYHNYGLALDFVLMINGKESWQVDSNWMLVVDTFKKFGFTWGGDFPGSFKDYPHLENQCGHNWRELLALYDACKFIPGTNYVNI